MAIRDKTGEQPSITREDRALQYFTDRHALIRRFVERVHAEPPPERILFFYGDGGNGKSLLLRYLRTYWCKRLHYWKHNRSLSDAALVERLQEAEDVTPLPVAELDFNQQPHEFEQPKQPYDGLLMLRRQLGGYGLHFPLYDFASIWYLKEDKKLTKERLESLFPAAEMDLIVKLADVATGGVVGGIVENVLGVFKVQFKEQWALRRLQSIADARTVEKIMRGDYRKLPLHLPTYFAKDLSAAMRAEHAPPRIVLFFDGYESLQRGWESEDAGYDPRDAGGWVRHLLLDMDIDTGVVPVVAGRHVPRWARGEVAEHIIPDEYVESIAVGHFPDADALIYLERAGVEDAALRERLCDYARVRPGEVHPLYAGLSADVVLQAEERGERLTAEDFPEDPGHESKHRTLVERLLRYADDHVADATRALSAARAFDYDLFCVVGERLHFRRTKVDYDTLCGFSFVWSDDARGSGWHRIHDLLRRTLQEREDARAGEAHAALEAIYRERAESGEPLAPAEAIYHAYQQEPERALNEWVEQFEAALKRSDYALCDALLDVRTTFEDDTPWWRARLAQAEGRYLFTRSRYAEARASLEAAIQNYNLFLENTPDYVAARNNKGVTLENLGELQFLSSEYDAARRAYEEALASFDEALEHAPDDAGVHNNKGGALTRQGKLLTVLGEHEAARRAYEAAVISFDEALERAPDDTEKHNNKGVALTNLGQLQFVLSEHAAAREAYEAAVASFDEALERAPDLVQAHNNRGDALTNLGELQFVLSKYAAAREAYEAAAVSFDEALEHAPDFVAAHSNRSNVLASLGELLKALGEHEAAREVYAESIDACDKALERAPGNVAARNRKGIALTKQGELLAALGEHEAAREAYEAAAASFDEALRRAPDNIAAYSSKGRALTKQSELLVLATLARREATREAYAEAVAAYDEALKRAPDDVATYNNKGITLQSQGHFLSVLGKQETALEAYEAAVASFDEALKRAPDLIQAYNNKGNTLKSQGRLLAALVGHEAAREAYEAAIAAYDEALEQAPQYLNALKSKADVFILLAAFASANGGREQEISSLREAAQLLGEALDLTPDDAQVQDLLARIEMSLKLLGGGSA